ncbi:MAG: cobalamin-dependent protein, partial [Lachnospiraceae bacterium]|nr:cobalamin-dependent protein [Lachnospiraceae bacterium]
VKFETLLPMAKKYGAMFILLPLSDEGLPKDLEEKKRIIHTIMDRALELGMHKEDIVVDGLVATVGANKNAALETLETIAYCKSLGLATICGLSNISFGLPERIYVNTAFLTMAIANGLTMAIANPSQQLLVNAAYASDLLLNKPEADVRYIELMNLRKERGETLAVVNASAAGEAGIAHAASNMAAVAEDTDDRHALKQAVLKGRKDGIAMITGKLVESGEKPKEILDQILLPAIGEVGELFDKGKYFLPQLIASAEAMKNSIEFLEPLLMKEQTGEDMPTVVIATVEGDIHDIGKNLVALMLKNYGFRVIDLGKDVKREDIIAAAKEHNASIIALSALMTTTMQQMKRVIELKKQEKLQAKVIIGGAVITQEYADEIGADGYSKDAQEAVKLTRRLLNMEEK